MEEGALQVEVNAVAPALRGGWVNLLMVEGLARRTGATALPDQLEMRRSLSG